MKSIIYLCSITILIASCHSTQEFSQSTKQAKRSPLPELKFYLDTNNDGNFESVEIEEENRPIPIQGKDQWVRDFYGSIRYPAAARQNGIGGIVILSIEIDQQGKVISVDVKNGISRECDDEAKRAYIYSTQKGYYPILINDMPTKVLMEVPVRFNLE